MSHLLYKPKPQAPCTRQNTVPAPQAVLSPLPLPRGYLNRIGPVQALLIRVHSVQTPAQLTKASDTWHTQLQLTDSRELLRWPKGELGRNNSKFSLLFVLFFASLCGQRLLWPWTRISTADNKFLWFLLSWYLQLAWTTSTQGDFWVPSQIFFFFLKKHY